MGFQGDEAAGSVAVPPGVRVLTGRKINVPAGTDDARIEWNGVPGATYYKVYQEGRFEAEAGAPANSCYDTDTNSSWGAFIATEYQVLACNKAGRSASAATVLVR